MASRSLESRWVRRYRVFFVLSSAILSVQVFLAYKFFPVDIDGGEKVQEQREMFRKPYSEAADNLNGVILSQKAKENYVTDDEDGQSNSNLVNGLYNKPKVPPDKLVSIRSDAVVLNKVPPPANLKNSGSFVVNRSILRLEELDFVPLCDIATKEAISAIHRAKTQQCKQEIANITCLIQQGLLYPHYLPNTCPSLGFSAGKSLGCFRDNKTFRLLSGYYANLKTTNSPKHCIDLCLQSGFPYAGVQFSTQCFCGNDEPPSTSRLPDSSCNMKCPTDPREACGGYFTINVYETGITKFVSQVPRENPESMEQPARIAFLLTLNGRALRQVRRLIKALFHVDHYFYIHVDARQDYLFRELLPLENTLPNVRLARRRYATIWGGASLLQMLLASISELLKIDWQWDFIINLSESDFPVKTNLQLVEFLTANKERNFVKSHGREVQRFIQKQGLDKTFVECDAHMWRIGDRHLPWGIQVDGGSDWVALSRPFASYVASTVDQLLQGLRVVFKHTLLPAETFFHTVLRNSKFCNTYVDNNLHVTNWKRRLGCKCQYKHVVDWCGCSPNDFKPDDWPRLQGTEGRHLFFARKFEPIINQAIIGQVEDWLYGPYPTSLPSLQSYWQNILHHADLSPAPDDALLTLSMSFARLAANIASSNSCSFEPSKILEVTSYHLRDSYMGTLVMFEGIIEEVKLRMETWVQPQHYMSISNSAGMFKRLQYLHVSSEYDQKEQISRNFIRALGPFSEPVLIYQFHSTSNSASSNANTAHAEHSGTNVTVLWIDPTGHVADVSEVHLEESVTIGSVKLFLREPLTPGDWKVKVIYSGSAVAETRFLVTPLQFVSGSEVSHQQSRYLHSVPNVSHSISEWDKFLENTDRSALHEKAVINSRKFGVDLREWIDSLTSRFYKVIKTCLASSKTVFKQELCLNLNDSCTGMNWSSLYPDPKCTITNVNETTGHLTRW